MIKKKTQEPAAPVAKPRKKITHAQIEARFLAVFENSRDAIGVSKAGILLFVNPAYLTLFRFPPATDLAGRPIIDLVAPDRRSQIQEYVLRRTRGQAVPSTYETCGLRADGTEFDMEVNVSIYQENGEDHTLVILRDITEQKKAEEKIREGENNYEFLVEATNTGYVIIDGNGLVLDANPQYVRISGHDRLEEILNRSVVEWTAMHDLERNAKEVKKCAEQGFVRNLEIDYVDKHGRFTPVELNATVMRRDNVVRIFTLCRDITERKRADEMLCESENRTRSIIESIPIGMHMYRLEPDGRLVFTGANPAADTILGVDNSIFIGKTIEEAFPSLKGTEVPQRYREAAAMGRAWQTESIEYQDNAIKGAFEVNAFQTSPNTMVAVFEDITVRKKSEMALKKSEKMLQTIIDTEPDCIKIIDKDSRLIMMNRAGLEMLQADSLEQVTGQFVYPLVVSPHQQAFMDLTKGIFEGRSGRLIFEMTGLKGRRLWLETHAVPLRNEENEITALLGVTRDITEQRRIENDLRESEKRFRTLSDAAFEAIAITEKGIVLDANKQLCTMLGYTLDGIRGMPVADIIAPEDRELVRHNQSTEYEAPYENRLLRRDGTIVLVESRAQHFMMQNRRVRVTVLRDISERKRLEQEHLKSEKLESVGTLAGGIAHDFNNLLQGIFGYISMAKMTYDQKEKSLAMLGQAEAALHLAVNLTTQLLTFSKGGKPIKKLIRLRPAVESAVKFSLSGSQTDYQIDSDEDLWPVKADEGQLAQVIQNVVLNAQEAMAGSGTIGIALRNTEIARNAHAGLAAGGQFVCIEILDSGTGISEQNLAKIFDPYFTTKQRGSGLGLATSYSIIRNHDGVIEVRSEANKGTKFTIYLPAAKGAELAETGSTTKGITAKTGRILLMDDEPLVRNVAVELISALGHEVESAAEGKTALDMFIRAREAGRPYDVVVLDLTIKGGMGGEETIRKMREIDPGVKAVVSSGYADNAVTAKYREHGFSAFLNKPYRFDALKDCLSALIK